MAAREVTSCVFRPKLAYIFQVEKEREPEEEEVATPVIILIAWQVLMYRRLEYKHDYFGDVDISTSNKKKHSPIVIHAENLSLNIAHHHPLYFWRWEKDVHVFTNLNFQIAFGKLFGITGPDVNVSSTLVRTLACKIPGVNKNASTYTSTTSEIQSRIRFTHAGHVYYNEKYPDKETISKVDFVGQDNFFHQFLTVRETVSHFARLQYPHLDEGDLSEKVVQIITEMGLTSCSASEIGSYTRMETTAEDKIRLRIALQMLNNPSVLFLEDPFRDLDDNSCVNLINLLVEISSRGPSVIFSMSSTKSHHAAKLHDVLVLNELGECVYVGHSGDELEKYLTGSGQVVEKGVNPLDKLMQAAHMENNQQSRTLVDRFKQHKPSARSNTSSTQKLPPELTEDLDPLRHLEQPPFSTQLGLLIVQNFRNTFRNKKLMGLYLLLCIIMGLLPPQIFQRIAHGNEQPWDILGICFFLAVLQPYAVQVLIIYKVAQEIPAILQEYSTAKRPRSFFGVVVARFVVQGLLDLVYSTSNAAIVYWVSKSFSGVYSVENFFVFFGVCILVHVCAVSWAFLCGSLFSSFHRGVSFATVFSIIGFLVSGYAISPIRFPSLLHWAQYMPYQSYAYELYLLVANDLHPILLNGQLSSILLNMPIQSQPAVFRALVLVLFTIFNHVIAGFLLWHLFRNHSQVKIEPLRRPGSVKSALNYNSSFDGSKLAIPARTCLGLMEVTARVNSAEVVRGVSGIFRSGELVLALGDKESGLSALLDIIAGKFLDVYGPTAEMAGKLHINNYQPHPQFLKTLVGHVHSGAMFFGKLTTKETLNYYALLKMSRSAPVKDKKEKADNLLREFGFSDKLYTPACDLSDVEQPMYVDDESERRGCKRKGRSAVIVIVIVDDQFRGLDFTATKDMLELLKKIAQQGRIVICSAQYAQWWMINAVDGVMLMSLGAVAFFGRSARLMRHFKKTGFAAPPSTDVILYILGLLRTDTHSSSTEVTTKNRIRAILEKWNPQESMEEVLEMQKSQFPKIQMVSDLYQYEMFLLLFKRMVVERMRHPHLIVLTILMPLLYSALVSIVFSGTLTLDLIGIQSRLGLIFAANLYLVFGFFHGLLVFPNANEMFLKEYKDKSCTPSGFYLAYIISNFAIEFVTSVMIALLVLFANHMNASAKIYFSFVFFLLLLLSSGHSFAIVLISVVPNQDVAVSLFAIGMTIVLSASAVLSTGVFIVLDYFRYTSIFTHFSFVTCIHEFIGLNFACTGPALFLTYNCPVSGGTVLDALRVEGRGGEGMFIGLAVACTVVYQVIAFLCFSKVQKALIKR